MGRRISGGSRRSGGFGRSGGSLGRHSSSFRSSGSFKGFGRSSFNRPYHRHYHRNRFYESLGPTGRIIYTIVIIILFIVFSILGA